MESVEEEAEVCRLQEGNESLKKLIAELRRELEGMTAGSPSFVTVFLPKGEKYVDLFSYLTKEGHLFVSSTSIEQTTTFMKEQLEVNRVEEEGSQGEETLRLPTITEEEEEEKESFVAEELGEDATALVNPSVAGIRVVRDILHEDGELAASATKNSKRDVDLRDEGESLTNDSVVVKCMNENETEDHVKLEEFVNFKNIGEEGWHLAEKPALENDTVTQEEQIGAHMDSQSPSMEADDIAEKGEPESNDADVEIGRGSISVVEVKENGDASTDGDKANDSTSSVRSVCDLTECENNNAEASVLEEMDRSTVKSPGENAYEGEKSLSDENTYFKGDMEDNVMKTPQRSAISETSQSPSSFGPMDVTFLESPIFNGEDSPKETDNCALNSTAIEEPEIREEIAVRRRATYGMKRKHRMPLSLETIEENEDEENIRLDGEAATDNFVNETHDCTFLSKRPRMNDSVATTFRINESSTSFLEQSTIFDRTISIDDLDVTSGACVGDRCLWTKNGMSRKGTIGFIGYLRGHRELYAGIDFDEQVDENRGMGYYEAQPLFTAKYRHAGFVVLKNLRIITQEDSPQRMKESDRRH